MRDARSLPVPRRRGWHRKRRVWHRCRTACDAHAGHAGWSCCTSHLPPEIRRPAPRGVHRAAVGRSSDSWMRHRRTVASLVAASRDHHPSASCDLVSIYRCGAVPGWARIRRCRPHRLPFSSCSLWLPEPTATTYWASPDSSTDPGGIARNVPCARIPRYETSRRFRAFSIRLREGRVGHTNEKRAEARFPVNAMTRRLTRPRRPRLRPRPSSTGGCGPACRLPAP